MCNSDKESVRSTKKNKKTKIILFDVKVLVLSMNLMNVCNKSNEPI